MERKHKKMDDFERIFEAYGADYQVTLGRFMGKQENVYEVPGNAVSG